MFAAEQLLQALTYEELFYTLKSMQDDDCSIDDFLGSEIAEDFMYMLDVYDLIFITSDGRVLLTPKGNKVLQYLNTSVGLGSIKQKNHVD